MIEAKVLLDSISQLGRPVTAFKLRYPKFIHSEFMTHRLISRNASSSRAVPIKKMIAEVSDDDYRVEPVWWGANQKGMQAAEELDDKLIIGKGFNQYGEYSYTARQKAQELWKRAAWHAAQTAEQMDALGMHKQIVNRILEPFTHINVVATATEWDNFFGLRLHKDAQPEMRALAAAMWKARQASTPVLLNKDFWHLPFVGHVHDLRQNGTMLCQNGIQWYPSNVLINDWIKVSVARCARVSYESFVTGKMSTVAEDMELYDKLLGPAHVAYSSDDGEPGPLHASPAEHQCTPDAPMPSVIVDGIEFHSKQWQYQEQHGNFVGWRQYRKMLPGEAVAPLPKAYWGQSHTLFKDGDAGIPYQIRDSNGHVVLGLCKVCGAAESELTERRCS